MVDYSSWKVADLKAELKNRGIPQTGLRLKQQFIDKLVEEDGKAQAEGTPAEQPAEAPEQPEETPDTAQKAQDQQPDQQQAEEAQQLKEPPTQDEPPSLPAAESQKAQDGVEVKDQAKEEQYESGGGPAEEAQTAQAVPQEEVKEPAEQTAEQAPGDMNGPSREESATLPEKAEPPTLQVSETNTQLSTPLPLEEALEDTRKRKRRSQSPVPTPEAIANKKARAKEETPRVLLKDDRESVPRDVALQDSAQEEQKGSDAQKEESQAASKDARFRDLFAPTEPAPVTTQDVPMDDADVEPAMHPATTSLYIDGLMRPLQPVMLRNHLISLASAPGTSPNANVIVEFFLDAIKTHCFVTFSSIAAASRVRAALHGKVWPNESNRKNLWVDFIPEQQIPEWIRTEQDSRDRPGPPVRWEIQYEDTHDGKAAVLAEAVLNRRSAPSNRRDSGFNRTPPLGPRGSFAQAGRRPSNVPAGPSSQPEQGFKPLDELFKSTTTKPKLYYLPVPRRVADKRLDQFDELLRKGTFPRRGGDEMRRITFEDEDYFVDGGPEYGARALQRHQERGGRGGRYGGPRRGY